MGLGGMEILIILAIALVIFGPKKLPEMGRSLGKAIREFKSAGSELQDELTRAANEPEKNSNTETVSRRTKPPESS